NDALLEKLKSNLQEVRARGGELYVVADLDSHLTPGDGIHVIRVAEHRGLLSPIVHVVPLQLLAYHTAVLRGTDVDKPRNLAKSVTVERLRVGSVCVDDRKNKVCRIDGLPKRHRCSTITGKSTRLNWLHLA